MKPDAGCWSLVVEEEDAADVRLALYLVGTGVLFGALGAFARAVMRRDGRGTPPGVQSLSLPLVIWGRSSTTGV